MESSILNTEYAIVWQLKKDSANSEKGRFSICIRTSTVVGARQS